MIARCSNLPVRPCLAHTDLTHPHLPSLHLPSPINLSLLFPTVHLSSAHSTISHPSNMAATEADAPPKRVHIEAGLQPDSVYAAALAPWRDGLRRSFVSFLPAESEWIASVQREYRTKGRDKFFFWSAVFGSESRHIPEPIHPVSILHDPGAADNSTHILYRLPPAAFLPRLRRQGPRVSRARKRGLPRPSGTGSARRVGRRASADPSCRPMADSRMVFVVGLGIYLSCVVKDIVCTPRPYAPPVTRLCEFCSSSTASSGRG